MTWQVDLHAAGMPQHFELDLLYSLLSANTAKACMGVRKTSLPLM